MSCTNITLADNTIICEPDNLQRPTLDTPKEVGDREFNSDAFYSTLWMLVILLGVMAACTLLGLYKIGRIPPPEKRPTESQI